MPYKIPNNNLSSSGIFIENAFLFEIKKFTKR